MRYSPFATLNCLLFATALAAAQEDSAGLGGPVGGRRIDLTPTTRPVLSPGQGNSVTISGWTYRAVKSPSPRDSVPWELIAEPAEPSPGWQKGRASEGSVFGDAGTGRGDIVVGRTASKSPIPIVEVPDVLWKQWLAASMGDVVGIHFHEVVTSDVARILFTLHRVPPEEPPHAATSTDRPAVPHPNLRYGMGRPAVLPELCGCRIEATLLAPVTYCLDQAIVVRRDEKKSEVTDQRSKHELGHAQVSQKVFFVTMGGPQTWQPQFCTGRRSRIEYYWKREKIGRPWEGFRGGVGELTTLRTIAVLVPPTRWSMMLPIPPERVTSKHLQEFNDAIVRVSQQFIHTDAAAQEQFHAQHGTYEP